MAELFLNSSLSQEQVTKNFSNTSFFDSLMTGLHEALDYAQNKNPKSAVARKRSLPDIDVATERASLNMTQKAFASVLGVSVRTVEAWEAGKCTPSPTARKLMYLISTDHSIVARLQN